MTVVEKYIRDMAEFMKKFENTSPNVAITGNMYEFLLKNGRAFDWKPRPKGVRKQRDGLCYMNAYRLANRNQDKYTYVEGIGIHYIPTEHAWCITEDGTVVDPTWHEDGKVTPEYFGVPLRMEWINKTLLRTSQYGVLWDWRSRYPILRDTKEEWRIK